MHILLAMISFEFYLTFDDFKNRLSSTSEKKYLEVLKNESIYNQVVNTLKNNNSDTIRGNSYIRMLVHTICQIYGATSQTVKKNVSIRIYCSDFLPEKSRKTTTSTCTENLL